MNSYHKTLLIIGLLALPLFTLANSQDYLVVSATYANGVFSNVAVNQQAIESSQVHIYNSGTYEIRLIEGSGMVSNNFFEVPANQDTEVIGGTDQTGQNSTYGTYRPASQIIQVVLPLTKSISADSTSIQILQGDQVVFDKKLSELALNIFSAANNHIAVSRIEPIFPPYPAIPSETFILNNYLTWAALGVLALLIIVGIIFFLKRRRSNNNANPPTITPPASQ